MTTPAVNTSSSTLGSVHNELLTPYYWDIGYNVGKGHRYSMELRPASANAPRLGGFKLPSSWSHSGYSYEQRKTSTVFATPWESHRYTGDIWDFSNSSDKVPQYPSDSDLNECLQKCLNRLNRREFHLGNFLGEIMETIHMIAGHSRTIANQVRKFRRNRSKWFAEAVKYEGLVRKRDWCKIPRAWLELQYGWNPLIQDVFGALNHLAYRAQYDVPIVTARAAVKTHRDVKITASPYNSYYTGSINASEECITKVGLLYGVSSPTLYELSSLGLINPAEILWEVRRFSFVVDWFLPIGNWLSAVHASQGLSFIGGYQTRFTKRKLTGGSCVKVGGVAQNSCEPPNWKGEGYKMLRTALTSTPVPGLYVKSPISVTHALNSLALLAESFRVDSRGVSRR